LANNQAEIINIPKIPAYLLTRLYNVKAVLNVNAQLRIKVDNQQKQFEAASIYNGAWRHIPTLIDLIGNQSLRYHVYAHANLTDYLTWYGVWAWRKTVADKILLGMPLTPDEQALDTALDIRSTVERGTLPPKIDRQMLYEYYPIYEWTDTFYGDVPVAGVELAAIRPSKEGRFVVLTRVSADTPALSANNTRITICRDNDGTDATPFISLPTFTLNLLDEIPMFIPALTDIRLRAESAAGETNYAIRWTYVEYPLTTILRVRFGMVTRDELPEDYKTVWDKVKAGIV
jgi:hypothetical protein